MAITVQDPTTRAEDGRNGYPSWAGRLGAALEHLLVVVLDPDYPDLLKPGPIEVARNVWAEWIDAHPHMAPFITAEVAELLGQDVTGDEMQIARLTGDAAFTDLPSRCDRCHGTDTHNPEGVCDDCLASLDSPAIDGGGF